MPGPILVRPQLPSWADPKERSVFDKPGQGMLRTIVGWLGLDDPNQVMALGTPLETGAMTGGLLDAVASKFPRFANAIKAYHGSPHDFAPEPGAPLGQFKSAAIGTGEGAQAYGHGLYFAENPAVAEGYKADLTRRPITLLGEKPLTYEQGAILDAFRERNIPINDPDVGRSVGDVMLADPTPKPRTQATHEKWQHAWETLRPRLTQEELAGKTYEVNIQAHPDHFLDWDKSVSQQSEPVRDALRALGVQPDEAAFSVVPAGKSFKVVDDGGQWWGTYRTQAAAERKVQSLIPAYTATGESAYGRLASGSAGGPPSASQALKDAGVAGIKYLDAGSRTAGEGSRNFVVFDDQTIEILRKYGILLPAAGLGGAAATQTGEATR